MLTSHLLTLATALLGSSMANPVPQPGNAEVRVMQPSTTGIATLENLDNLQIRRVASKATATTPAACTLTIPTVEPWTWGPVRTIYTTTTTSTKSIDCGSCTALDFLFWGGVQPIPVFNETVTAVLPKTTSVSVCAKPTPAAATP